ncbi:MAG TPA: response regulator [Anaeromyxobacteraceae bacterium]|nr:response regulator [Anaeromyxobacteraceae bacterium]
MAKTILLIESDAAFARELSKALEARGFGVRVSAEGKEGLDVARDLRPDAIVLCVELPRMSGYSVCNKLKKDDALKSIPLIVISAEATPETFEQHRKLKTRAEDYLIKPFPPETLVERLGALVGLPAQAPGEEEMVTLADVELDQVVQEIPPLDLTAAEEDEDLRLLDDAFDSIAGNTPLAAAAEEGETPPLAEAAPADALEEMAVPLEAVPEELASPSPDDLQALESLPTASEDFLRPAEPEEVPAELMPASADLLRAAGIPVLESEPPPEAQPFEGEALLADEPGESQPAAEAREEEIRALREELSRLRGAADQAEHDGAARDSELRATRARLEAVHGTVRKLEADLKGSRDEARRALERAAALEKDVAAMRARLEEVEQVASQRGAETAEALARAESLERSLDEARTELTVTRNEAESLRGEAERRTADLRRRLTELESQTARHEERVVKAYQKIKSDEKLKEKTRKALAVALQLLDERLPVEGTSDPAAGGPERPAS